MSLLTHRIAVQQEDSVCFAVFFDDHVEGMVSVVAQMVLWIC